MTAVARVYRWEVAKLLAQKRTYLGLLAAAAIPVIFVVVLEIQSGQRTRTTFHLAATSETQGSPSHSSCCSSCRSGGSRS